jgi:saccharopine dehydrogenase-like NADP-dependent oxidoreductase
MQIMEALMRSGSLSNRPVTVGDQTLSAIELASVLLAGSPVSKENPIWGYGLVVEVRGSRNGRSVTCTYRSHHPPAETWGGDSAYFKNVGIPLSIGAQLIASGQVPARGVIPPEIAFPVKPFFDALALRGITVEEIIIDEGVVN